LNENPPFCKKSCNPLGEFYKGRVVNSCGNCPDNCRTCDDLTGDCNQCDGPFFLRNDDKFCQRTCSNREYNTGDVTNTCQACGSNCQECTFGNGECSKCEENYFVHPNGSNKIDCVDLPNTLSI
jgi:hypothetical protein